MNQRQHAKKNRLLWLLMILPIAAIACALSARSGSPDNEQVIVNTPVVVVATVAEETPAVRDSEQSDVQLLPAPSMAEEQAALVALYARVNPSVVNITTYIVQEGNMYPNSQGSGFVFDQNGHIVTNAHVVHGSEQVDVSFANGDILPAQIIGEDLHSDLAVIKIDTLPPGVMPVELGKINEVVVGQTVVAIGNPFGLGGTLTRGIVSALGRTIPALTSFSIPRSIQTDAAINPGNSGGPLLNLQGQVIGVNAQIQTNSFSGNNSGVGFAIPVSIVKRVIPEMIENGYYDWAWLGVAGTDMSPVIAEAMNVEVVKGAYLSSIVENGPAEKAGLFGSVDTESINGRTVHIGGDVIVAINGQPVNSFDDLLIYVALESSPGKEVTLTILRDGELIDVVLKLDSRPETIENLLP